MNNLARHLTVRNTSAAIFAFLFCFASIIPASAASDPRDKFPEIDIDNFGRVDENFFRGEQPDEEDYAKLASLGIKAVIDLRDDPKDFARSKAEAAGMKYFNIPMSDKSTPRDEQINQFLEIAKNPANSPFYAHCKGGRHRTGVVGAVYRYTYDNWNYDQVYKEMKVYDYYSRWGHGKLKDYVRDYYQRIKSDKIEASTLEASNPSDR